MDRKYLIISSLAGIAIVSLASLLPSKNFAAIYTSSLQALALFLGFLFSLKAAASYKKELRKSFLFLAFFLLLYMLASISVIWQYLRTILGANTIFLVLFLQAADYAMLIASCVYTVKVIEIKRMNRYGWIVLGLLLVFCSYVITLGVPLMRSGFAGDPAGAVSNMIIRIFDMAIVCMLVPVLLLYVQHLRAKAQESITFTMIVSGIIISLLSTYIFEIVTGMPISQIGAVYFQTGSMLDVIYIFGYLLIVVGLYAHLKYDEWGYKMIEKALG